MTQHTPFRRFAVGLILVSVLAITTACAADSTAAPSLIGVSREEPLQVGSINVIDATEDQYRAHGIVSNGRLSLTAAPNRLLLVYFGFLNCPDVCPTTLADVRVALKDLSAEQRDRIDIVFITVDPDRDTPELLNNYMSHFFDSFHVVHEVKEVIDTTTDAFLASYTISQDGEDVSVAHTAVLYGVDDGGNVVVEWPFGTTGESIASDISLLLATTPDAAGGV